MFLTDALGTQMGTFALLLMANEAVRFVWGSQPIALSPPEALAGPVELLPGFTYPAYRLLIIGVGLAVGVALWFLITRTRVGMQVRAGASNREMAMAMGADVRRLFTALFALGAALCGVAGALLGPLLAVQVGMGESILILAFVVIVIGGIGSMRGALFGVERIRARPDGMLLTRRARVVSGHRRRLLRRLVHHRDPPHRRARPQGAEARAGAAVPERGRRSGRQVDLGGPVDPRGPRRPGGLPG